MKRVTKSKKIVKENNNYNYDDVTVVNSSDIEFYDKAWIIGLWGGSGYYLDRFLVFANNGMDALNETIYYLVETDHESPLILSFDEVYDLIKEIEDTNDEEEIYEFIDRDYVSGDNYDWFVRLENLTIKEIDMNTAKEIVNERLNESKKKTIKEDTENKMEVNKKDERLFFENFKNKLHKNVFGHYEVYNWIYDMTGIMPHDEDIQLFIDKWIKNKWIDTQTNQFGETLYLISRPERLAQKAPIVKNIPIAESKKRKMIKEAIDFDTFSSFNIHDDRTILVSKDVFQHREPRFNFDYQYVLEGFEYGDGLSAYGIYLVPTFDSLKPMIKENLMDDTDEPDIIDIFYNGYCILLDSENDNESYSEEKMNEIEKKVSAVNGLLGFYLDKGQGWGEDGWDRLKKWVSGKISKKTELRK